MSPRKRLSPNSPPPRLVSKPHIKGDGGGPPVLPSLMPRNRQAEEARMVRLLCWVTVVLTMGAISVVFVVEQRSRSRNLGIAASLLPLEQQQQEQQQRRRRSMNLLFQTHSIEAPVCNEITPEDVSFTLVTQCSDNRLWMLEHHCERWTGPISLVVYTNHTQQYVEQVLRDMNCHDNDDTTFLQIHPADTLVDYPINALRNMALSGVQTTHALYVDVDFWPARELYEVLDLHREYLADDDKRALVVPAFSLVRQCKEWRECPLENIPQMPATTQDVYDGLAAKRIFPFDPTNRGGHGSTRYPDWLTQSAHEVLPIDCFQSRRYEPYLVVRYCQDLPPFQEGFTGYGKNKVSWVMQLRRAGWTFGQIGQGFVTHYPHLDSPARQAWNGVQVVNPVEDTASRKTTMMRRPSDDGVLLRTKRGANDQLFVEFRDWLDAHYPLDNDLTFGGEGDGGEHGSGIRTRLCDQATDDDAKLWVAREPLL